jgi:hypothetical protein
MLDLTGLDADILTAGTQSFTLLATNAAFTKTAGELRFDSAKHTLSGDLNGDGYAEFTFNLTGVTDFDASNLKV